MHENTHTDTSVTAATAYLNCASCTRVTDTPVPVLQTLAEAEEHCRAFGHLVVVKYDVTTTTTVVFRPM